MDLRELGNDAKILIHVIDEFLDIHRHFAGEQKLLFVELPGHFFLERLMEKLSEDDDEGEDDEERQDDYRGSQELFLLEGADKALKHEVIYCQWRAKVKEEKDVISVLGF